MSGFRHFSSSEHTGHRFGFNGMEKDDEVKGNGNHYTTLFRQYDPRTGRWFSIDPKTKNRAHLSPYVSMDDNPILLNDPKGDCPPGVDCGEKLETPAGVHSTVSQSQNMPNPFALNEGGRMSLPKRQQGSYKQELMYTSGGATILSETTSATRITKSVDWMYNDDRSEITLSTTTTTTTVDLSNEDNPMLTSVERSTYKYQVRETSQLRLLSAPVVYQSRNNTTAVGTTSADPPTEGGSEFLQLVRQEHLRRNERIRLFKDLFVPRLPTSEVGQSMYEDSFNAVDNAIRSGNQEIHE